MRWGTDGTAVPRPGLHQPDQPCAPGTPMAALGPAWRWARRFVPGRARARLGSQPAAVTQNWPAAGPGDALWSWQPALTVMGTGQSPQAVTATRTALAPAISLCHDDPGASIRAQRSDEACARGVSLSLDAFSGRYVSVVADLPPRWARMMTADHLLQVSASLSGPIAEPPYLRLNLRQGPNVVALPEAVEQRGPHVHACFDLAHHDILPAPVRAAWVDLIIDRPGGGRIDIGALRLSLQYRARY